jgi:hypothetical protein
MKLREIFWCVAKRTGHLEEHIPVAGVLSVNAFHEKAGRSQVDSLGFSLDKSSFFGAVKVTV